MKCPGCLFFVIPWAVPAGSLYVSLDYSKDSELLSVDDSLSASTSLSASSTASLADFLTAFMVLPLGLALLPPS